MGNQSLEQNLNRIESMQEMGDNEGKGKVRIEP